MIDHAAISETIQEGIEENENLRLPENFRLEVNAAGALRLFAEIDGVRCFVHATPFYEGADGIALSVEAGDAVDVKDEINIPHIRQIVRLSSERGEEFNASDKFDLAFLWLERVAPKAEALNELLSA